MARQFPPAPAYNVAAAVSIAIPEAGAPTMPVQAIRDLSNRATIQVQRVIQAVQPLLPEAMVLQAGQAGQLLTVGEADKL